MQLPDISEYYIGERAVDEEAAWSAARQYSQNLTVLTNAVARFGARSVVEAGCGSGWVAAGLPPTVERYLGIDKNGTFLAWAQAKANGVGRSFELLDLRHVTPAWLGNEGYHTFDLVASFAVLKHFGLHEWDEVAAGVFALARHGCVAVQTSDNDFDDGIEFHHTAVTQDRVARVLAATGNEVVETVTLYDGVDYEDRPIRETVYLTRRMS